MILDALTLSENGRPVLLDGEVELSMMAKVDLIFPGEGGVMGALAEKYKGGRVVLTSHRVLWIDTKSIPPTGPSCYLALGAVHSWSTTKSMMGKSQKLKLQVFLTLENKPAEGRAGAVDTVKLSLLPKDYVPDSFQQQLQEALSKKMWEKTGTVTKIHGHHAPPAKMNATTLQQLIEMGYNPNRAARALQATNGDLFLAIDWISTYEHDPSLDEPLGIADRQGPWSTSQGSQATTSSRANESLGNFGVASIIKRQEDAAQQADRSLSQAFQDLNGLMSKAQEMVKLAERLRGSVGANDVDKDAFDEETMAEMISMGIASPVTKETAGALYHQELSRQLSDFLKDPLTKAGGLMTLPDVYCRFNRARGTELISPDDLLQAANLFSKIGAPLQMKAFPTGVTVIQSSMHDEKEVGRKISGIVQEGKRQVPGLGKPITASDVATELGTPLSLAQEHLMIAESMGILCRDDGPEGLRYFGNFFNDGNWR